MPGGKEKSKCLRVSEDSSYEVKLGLNYSLYMTGKLTSWHFFFQNAKPNLALRSRLQ